MEAPNDAFTPGIFDRLLDVPVNGASTGGVLRITIEDVKDSVARDLEALLNTRNVIPDRWLTKYPESRRSILAYGLNDVAGRSLASADDRAFICKRLEKAIASNEPRLRQVRATLALEGKQPNCLHFTIHAMLVASSTVEPVNFDALLQPSSLHYTVSNTRGAAPSGA